MCCVFEVPLCCLCFLFASGKVPYVLLQVLPPHCFPRKSVGVTCAIGDSCARFSFFLSGVQKIGLVNHFHSLFERDNRNVDTRSIQEVRSLLLI